MKNFWKLLAAIAIVGGLAACKKDKGPKVPTDFSGGCEAVDLGLSVKWASFNLGADEPSAQGDCYAWGETAPKTVFEWQKPGDYKWGVLDYASKPESWLTKYTGQNGDGLDVLQAVDDPATANWGTKWRTPTIAEFKELLDETKCQWTWDPANNVFVVKGLNTGNSIYVPMGGMRGGDPFGYWSSTLRSYDVRDACTLIVEKYDRFHYFADRCTGHLVRAVTEY